MKENEKKNLFGKAVEEVTKASRTAKVVAYSV